MADTYQDALAAQVKFAQEKGILRTPNPTFVDPVTSTSATDWSTANMALPYLEDQGVSAEAHRAGIAIAKASLGPNPSTKVTQMIQEAAAKPDEAVTRYRDQSAGAERISTMPQAERERAEAHLLTFTPRAQLELADPAYSARQVEGLQNTLARHNGLVAFDVSPDLQRLAYQSYRDVHAVMSHYLSTGDAEASARYASNLAKSRDIQHLTNLHNDAIRMEAGESAVYGGATGYSQFHTSRALESAERMLNAEGTSARLGGAYFANNFNQLVVNAVMDGVRQEHGAGTVFHDTKSAQGLRDLGNHVAERMDLSFMPNPDGHGRQELAQQVIGMVNEQNGGKPDFRVESARAQASTAAQPTVSAAAPATTPVASAEQTTMAAAPTQEPPRQAELFHEPAMAHPQANAQSVATAKVEPTLAAPEQAAVHGTVQGKVEPTFANPESVTARSTASNRVEPTFVQPEPVAAPSTPAPAAHASAPETLPPAHEPVHEPAHEHAPEHVAAAAPTPATPDPVAAATERTSQLEGIQKDFAEALQRIQPTVLKQGMLGDGIHELHNPVLANGTGRGLSANVHGFSLAGGEELDATHFADVAVARASLGTDPLNTVQKLVQDAASSLPHHALAQEYSGLSEAMRERVQVSAEEKAHFATFGPSQADAAKSVFESSPDLQRLALHSYADAYSVVTQHIHSGAEEGANYAQRLALMRDVEHVASLKADAHQVAAGEASRFGGEHGYAQFHTSRSVESIAKMVKEMPDDYAWDKHSINALVGEAVREGLAHEHGMGLTLHNTRTAEGLNAVIDHTANRMALDNLPNPSNLTRAEQVSLAAEGFYPKGVEFKPLEKSHSAEAPATPEHAAPQSAHAVATPAEVPHTAPVSPAPAAAEVAEAATHTAEAADIAKSGFKTLARDALKIVGGGVLGDALALEDLARFAGRALEFTSGGGKVGMYGALATGVGKETEVIQNVFDKTGVTAHVNQHASEAHDRLESGMAKVSEWARPVTDQYHKVEQAVEPKVHAVTDYVSDKASAVGHAISHHVDNVAHAASSRLEPVTSAIGHTLSPVTEPALHAVTEFAQTHKSSVDIVMHVGENITGIAMTDLAKGAAAHPQATPVQGTLNQALKAAGHEGTPLSAQEAQTVAAELRHVQPGDSLAIEKNGNIHLVPAGTQAPQFPEGATHVDAEALREAAGIARAPVQVANLESTHGTRER